MKAGGASAPGGRSDGSIVPIARELADALAELAHEEPVAVLIAKRAGFASHHFPKFVHAVVFWSVVLEQALDGRVERRTLLALVARALEYFPHNPELRACGEKLSKAMARDASPPGRSHLDSGLEASSSSPTPRIVTWRWLSSAGAALGIATMASFMLTSRSEGSTDAPMQPDASLSDDPERSLEDLGGSGLDSKAPAELTTSEASVPLGPVPSSCLRDADCGAKRRCERPKPVQQHLGTITKNRDRGSHTEIVGHQCINGKTRVGRPQGKVGAANGVECRVEWRLADEHSCEVDVILLGPQTEEARCDVYATLRSTRAPRGRCKPV